MSLPARRTIRIIFLLAAAAAACRRDTPKDAESEPPIPVIAEAVQIGDIRGVVSATGIVGALPGADFLVTAPEPARIAELFKNAGDHVKSGEILVRFEFPSLHVETAVRAAALRAADLRRQSAALVQSRVHSLFDRGAASQREVNDADREVVEADAELAQARAGQRALDTVGQRTTIRAPFDGIVAERVHKPGDMVGTAANDLILRLIDPRQVEVTTSVSPADAARFTVGASARAVAEGKGAPELLRVVARSDLEPGATRVPVRLTFEQPTELAVGTQVGIEIVADEHSNVVLVPVTALVKEANNTTSVFVAAGNQVRKRTVVPGLSDSQYVEITSGVKAGEMVITQGQSDLRDGAAITIGQ